MGFRLVNKLGKGGRVTRNHLSYLISSLPTTERKERNRKLENIALNTNIGGFSILHTYLHNKYTQTQSFLIMIKWQTRYVIPEREDLLVINDDSLLFPPPSNVCTKLPGFRGLINKN